MFLGYTQDTRESWDTWTGGVGATVLGCSWDTPRILGYLDRGCRCHCPWIFLGYTHDTRESWDTWTGGVGDSVLGYSWDTPRILGNPGILGQGV